MASTHTRPHTCAYTCPHTYTHTYTHTHTHTHTRAHTHTHTHTYIHTHTHTHTHAQGLNTSGPAGNLMQVIVSAILDLAPTFSFATSKGGHICPNKHDHSIKLSGCQWCSRLFSIQSLN